MKIIAVRHVQCDDLHIILSLSAVQIYDYFIYLYSKIVFSSMDSLDQNLKNYSYL